METKFSGLRTPIHNQNQTKGPASRAAAGGAKVYGSVRRHWNSRKYGAGKLRFPHEKEFVLKFSAVSVLSFGNFASPILD